LRGFSGLQRRTEHACVGADRQRVAVARAAAGEHDETAVAFAFRERTRTPGRFAAARFRDDPDLEDARGLVLDVVLGVADAAARAHHLHVARFRAALVAETVLVRDRAIAHIGDDFHVRVRMRRKTAVRGDFVVVPHAQRAQPMREGSA
jgi:hypothetical protein